MARAVGSEMRAIEDLGEPEAGLEAVAAACDATPLGTIKTVTAMRANNTWRASGAKRLSPRPAAFSAQLASACLIMGLERSSKPRQGLAKTAPIWRSRPEFLLTETLPSDRLPAEQPIEIAVVNLQ